MAYMSNIARSQGDPQILRSGPSMVSTSDRLGKALGWFSLALGMVELLAPRRITRALGMEGKETLVRAFGAREIGHGLLSLSPDKQAGLWSRVAGDGLDIVTLLTAMRDDNPKRDNVVIALTMVSAVTVLDVIGAKASAMRHARTRGQRRTYRDRSGFPQGVESAKGAAREFRAPSDMRAVPPLMVHSNPDGHRASAF